MDLTVIISYKDREENLKACLSSIEVQNNRPYVIVVDFGSAAIIEFLEDKSWLKIIRVSRNTKIFCKSRANNIGIKAARTKFVCTTDADQIFHKNFFNILYKELLVYSNCFFMCKTFILPNPLSFYEMNSYNIGKNFDILLLNAKGYKSIPVGNGCFHAMRRDLFLKLRGYEEQFIGWGGQDAEMTLRVRNNGIKIRDITKKTEMIHLPHTKIYDGYNSFREKNHNLYQLKKKKREKVANKNRNFGLL